MFSANRIGCLDPETDTDPANIIVDLPAIELTKIVLDPECEGDLDGQGVMPFYSPGASVTYQYTIDNTGTTALLVNLVDVADNGTPINLADDILTNLIVNGIAQPGVIISGDLNNNNLLDTDETWTVTFSAIVSTLGHNRNLASVVGTPVDPSGQPITSLSNVTDVDDADVFVAVAGINIEKRVNSKDANTEPPAFDHVPTGRRSQLLIYRHQYRKCDSQPKQLS